MISGSELDSSYLKMLFRGTTGFSMLCDKELERCISRSDVECLSRLNGLSAVVDPTPDGATCESRTVVVAGVEGSQVSIGAGLAVNGRVVLTPPPNLRDG